MFSKRADGRRIKSLAPYYKIVPYIMKERVDAHVYFTEDICIDNMEEYIEKQKERGIKIKHMDIILAAIGRVALEKPRINRFVMNRRIYARNEVSISLAIVKKLSDDDYVDILAKQLFFPNQSGRK